MSRPALAPLRDRRFRWYFLSRAVDLTGDMMGAIALAFAVLEVTDSSGALGAVLAASSIPMVVFLLVGGVLADRFGRTIVIQASNVIAGASLLTIATLVLSGTAEIWHLVVLGAVNGVAAAANLPALAGLLPELAPAGSLQQANALHGLLRNLAAVIAPAMGGALVAGVGPGWALGINGLTYLAAAALLLPIRLPPTSPRDDAAGVLGELRIGWNIFRTTTWLWVVVVSFAVLNALMSGGFRTLGPVLAESSEIGVGGWALILSVGACGLVLSSLVLLRLTLHRPLFWGMLGCSAYSWQMVALGTTSELWVLLAAAFVGGVGIEVFVLGWDLAMQEHVPKDMLSRVYAYDMLGSYVAIPVGQLAFGPLGAVFGVQPMILMAGAAYLAISLATLACRPVRLLERVTATGDAGIARRTTDAA